MERQVIAYLSGLYSHCGEESWRKMNLILLLVPNSCFTQENLESNNWTFSSSTKRDPDLQVPHSPGPDLWLGNLVNFQVWWAWASELWGRSFGVQYCEIYGKRTNKKEALYGDCNVKAVHIKWCMIKFMKDNVNFICSLRS